MDRWIQKGGVNGGGSHIDVLYVESRIMDGWTAVLFLACFSS
jgi:hypothetical protein